jgi:hypothetical protein
MIRMTSEVFENLDDIDGLRAALQLAIRLEHGTIPPYLFTMYSLDPIKNPRIFNLIRGVVKEEMAHLAIACNLLNAVGGSPLLNSPDFVMNYPGALPGSVHTALQVSLEPFSLEHIKSIFMEIEEPENPIRYKAQIRPDAQEFRTIGAFYRAISEQIRRSGSKIFTGDSARQVKSEMIGLPNVSPVTDPASAAQAINHIIQQGEGTNDLPTDDHEMLAHYYRFEEIYRGRELVKRQGAPPDAPADQRYSYAGPVIALDRTGIFAMKSNPKSSDYPPAVRSIADEFNRSYSQMLLQLHLGFNGDLSQLAQAIATMQPTLRDLAMKLAKESLGDGTNAGPTFEYAP